jgi:hypothetical protein
MSDGKLVQFAGSNDVLEVIYEGVLDLGKEH